jgi:hypothetical protein
MPDLFHFMILSDARSIELNPREDRPMIEPLEKLVFCAECPCRVSFLDLLEIMYAVIGGLNTELSEAGG